MPFFSFGPADDACFRYRLSSQCVAELIVQPCQNFRVESLHHQLGHDIGVVNEHGCRPQSNWGGSRMGSLGGISSSTPPNGLNRSCIAVPSSLVGTTSSSKAACRMARASCSMERPFSTARMRSFLFSPSSRLRTVMLATMTSPNVVVTSVSLDCTAIPVAALFGLSWFCRTRHRDPQSPWQSPVHLHQSMALGVGYRRFHTFVSFFSLRGPGPTRTCSRRLPTGWQCPLPQGWLHPSHR